MKDEIKGLTLRDYFAAKAMQSLINNASLKEGVLDCNDIAEEAYYIAAVMLRQKESENA